ncbi:hypothetical protein RvY_03674 [Ramazzottius varieornatus]|uniref:Reverse transcriptase domain-containing protein n=1 Tax=Ramazzottius varieornatus TaxID=947166 RepID=A0A1D1UNX3_RAMVA|nr:hypothetical protein RvY_03674 [Ramazzottius varieornatus]
MAGTATEFTTQTVLTHRVFRLLLKAAGSAFNRLFDLILTTKQYPSSWKKADVVPTTKKGGATWRPVSLLSPLYVPHNVLVKSLQDHGVTGDLLELMSDYLRGRTQRVTVGGYYSEFSEVRSGVSQGSVLDPLLFIVAVNKLSNSVKCELFQYADDLVAHQVIGEAEDCQAFQECRDQLGENCREAELIKELELLKVASDSFAYVASALQIASKPFHEVLQQHKASTKVLRQIPKGARMLGSNQFDRGTVKLVAARSKRNGSRRGETL